LGQKPKGRKLLVVKKNHLTKGERVEIKSKV